MLALGWLLLGLCGLVAAIRYTARFYCIPWPAYLSFWLRNPYMYLFCHPQRTIRFAGLANQQNVLELGCGAGRILVPAAQALPQASFTAVDLQALMLKKLIRRASAAGVIGQISVIQADLRQLDLAGQKFDRIILFTVLGEIPGAAAIVAALPRFLTVDGLVAVTEVLPDPCYIRRRVLERMFFAAGFAIAGRSGNLVSYSYTFKLR